MSTDGRSPFSGVVFDPAGNLYGFASGGVSGFGVVFELVPGTGGTWTQKVLYSFKGGNDGANPSGSLVFDQAGNLYGVAQTGGVHDYGVVFKLTRGSNGTWTEKVLYAFTGGAGGSYPSGGLVWDGAGNLYGAASSYLLFELASSSGGGWTEKTLHAFVGGKDGADPLGAPVFDKAGNLYGTTYSGGAHNGTVFELSPTSSGTWTETILHRFAANKVDGLNPGFTLAIDSAGNLYGATPNGGSSNNGVVFEVTP